ncbi:MAG: hypothetical protein Terrestrivirus4_105 [Terrestrivirus sp.]|uniref:Uncharacterized protein n=1 Tax=Terrestrivirus sp. TaxID=2487775 RepID=A0A3G4ZMI2_9VIRU|nr:MAG: hypothetical protein Terrestrivirus4_105 [Terrestrivirus sp.]
MSINKYSKKIIKFIDDQDVSIDTAMYTDINKYISEISKNHNINKIFDIISDTYKKTYITPGSHINTESYTIKKIHTIDQYPLIYIFLCKLYEKGLLDKIINEDFSKYYSSFYDFTCWYRRSHHNINTDTIHSVMTDYIDNDNNRKNDVDELIQIYTLLYKMEGNRKYLHDLLYSNQFIPLDVQHSIESNDFIIQEIKSHDFELIIYNYTNNDNADSVDVNKIIHIIYIMIEINKLVMRSKDVSKKIPNIILILGKQRKQISPENNYDEGILCPSNINSGSSIMGINVMIWRKEEVHKVLFHELIHFFGFDFHSHNHGYAELRKYVMDTYNVRVVDSPNESYTECIATIIHSLFVSFYTHKSFSDVFRYELLFTLYQVSKILSFYKISTIDELGYKIITQTTSVFSYFFIKGLLLFNIDKVFDFIGQIKGIKITSRVSEFKELIELCTKLSKKTYFIYINNMMKLNKSNNNYNNHDFISKTMRMTCWQID